MLKIINNILKFIKKKKKQLIILLLFFFVVFLIVLIKGSFNKKDVESEPFTIRKDNYYAVFNSKGKKLTDFEFLEVSSFYNNSAIVVNKKNQYGIINDKGNMVVKFGKYNLITKEGTLYKAVGKNKVNLVNSDGKVICNLKGKSINNYDKILVVRSDKATIFLDSKGKKILKFKDNNNYQLRCSKDNLCTLYYNNVSYVINNDSGKVINKIKSKSSYCISDVNKSDDNKYILSLCSGANKYEYYYKKKRQFVKKTSDCDNVSFSNNGLICIKNAKKYLLDDNGKLGVEVFFDYNTLYIDYYSYIRQNGAKVDFYVNNKLKKTVNKVKIASIASIDDKIYLLKDMSGTTVKYVYYNYNGKKIIPDEYLQATLFDSNGLARVSTNNKNYYLINTKGKKVSEKYKVINSSYFTFSSLNNGYVVMNDKTSYYLDKSGKEILPTSGNIKVYDSYFTVVENNVTKYYSFNGNLIYKN